MTLAWYFQNDSPELLVDIPGPEDRFLLKFLRAGNFDVIASVQVLKNYISMITTGPQVSLILPHISTYPKEQFKCFSIRRQIDSHQIKLVILFTFWPKVLFPSF